uniref:Predicted protein n=1 Tax=Hordeum vulgare subsp. vulgare TaxID=112509 RepID=F2D646_HORVV|nr:predicted protein [Hordeum vulgare subsp. vulgare]
MAFLLGQFDAGMAPHKTMTRTVRHYAPAGQRRRRVPVEEMEFVDGYYLSIEVSADLVLPRAKTVRQLRKRAQVLKGGSFGSGTTIVYSLTEAEKLLLNTMGNAEPVELNITGNA